MKQYKEPRDYGAVVQRLKNGKIIDRELMLEQAQIQYQQTKRIYNLSSRSKNGGPIEIPINRQLRNRGYSLEQAKWILNHTPKEVAQQYNISMPKAYAMRRHMRVIYGL